MIKKYRKKPEIIEAIQFVDTPEFLNELSNFIGKEATVKISYEHSIPYIKIKMKIGTIGAFEGDYIVKDVNGEFHSCNKDLFERMYELVE